MMAELFLMCALAPAPVFHSGNHCLTEHDGRAFCALTEPVRRYLHVAHPPVLFAHHYSDVVGQLRQQGIRAYGMTVALSNGHLKGLLGDLPFASGSLGALVLLQKVTYAELFEALETVSLHGVLLIREQDLPYLAEVMVFGLGFHKTEMVWNGRQIYRRHQVESKRISGDGFHSFNAKRVKGVVHANQRTIEAAA